MLDSLSLGNLGDGEAVFGYEFAENRWSQGHYGGFMSFFDDFSKNVWCFDGIPGVILSDRPSVIAPDGSDGR